KTVENPAYALTTRAVEKFNPNIIPKGAIPAVIAIGGNPLGLVVAPKNVKEPVPVSKMSFVEKLKAAIELVPGLLAGDAKAAFQQLVSNPEFIAELVAVGVVFAALQAVPVLGQAIDAALIIAFGFSAGFNLGSFFLNVFNAQDKKGLQAAANNFKNFLEAVGALTMIAALKLAGRLLRKIQRGASGAEAIKGQGSLRGGAFANEQTLLYPEANNVVGQLTPDSCVAACCKMVIPNGEEIPEIYLRELAKVKVGEGTKLSNAVSALDYYGVSAKYESKLSIEGLRSATANNKAAIVSINSEITGGPHALVIDGFEENLVLIRDPLPEGIGASYKLNLKTFQTAWNGGAIILNP
ncbi:MAG: cysteine peptidase family C39 domain-containing protein, partial [Microcoleus sp.]